MKFYLEVIIGIIVVFLVRCTDEEESNDQEVEDLYKEAASFTYIRQGVEIQEILYDSVISMNSNFANVWFGKSTWSIKIGDYINHFKFLNKAVELEPKIYTGYRGAMKLYYLRDYKGAIKDFNTTIGFFPNQKGLAAWGRPILFLLGKAYWQMKEYKTAVKYFNDYIKEETETSGEDWIDTNTFLYKGICLYKLAHYQDALESFKKGIQYNENFPEAYYHAGKTLMALKQKQEACEYFSKAKQYAQKGFIKTDAFREVFGQLHFNDIVTAIQENCH